jgi:hypothetical protein
MPACKAGRPGGALLGAVGARVILRIICFGAGVRAQLQGLAIANSDNIQWNMSQAEVEHLAFLVVAKGAVAKPRDHLASVRNRFDGLDGRVPTQKSTRPAILNQIEHATPEP